MSVNEKMTAIADNIRAKTGGTEPLTLDGMAESIPAVYAAGQSSMVDESKLIPKTVSGSYISVDDVSEIPHSVGCKVESVNLLNPNNLGGGEIVEYNGVQCYKYVDKYVSTGIWRIEGCFKENTQYTFTAKIYRSDTATATDSNYQIYYTDGTSTDIKAKSGVVTTTVSVAGKSISRIAPTSYMWETAYLDLSVSCLHEGTTALPYTPYVKPEEVKVTRTGKNIVDILNGAIQYKTVTIREKTENTIVLSCTGTYKGVCYILPKNLVGKYLTVSGEWDNANGAKGGLRINWIKTNNAADLTVVNIGTGTSGKAASGLVKPPPSDAAFLGLIVYGNSDGSIEGEGVVSYRNIQLEVSNVATEYEPYNGQTLTPNADGTVEGFTSVSPYMNIFSDTVGVNIKADYNKSWGMQTEYDRFWDNFQDYGTRTTYEYAFCKAGWNIDTFKPKYPIKPKLASFIFMDMQKLTGYFPDFCELDFSQATAIDFAFGYCYHNPFSLGVIDTTAAETISYMFHYARQLNSIDKLILKADGSQTINGTFSQCYGLTNVIIEGVIGKSVTFQDSPLNKASITSVVNTLSSTATGQTLTLKLSAVNTAFETSTGAADGSTSAEFAALVATKTNWTITMI